MLASEQIGWAKPDARIFRAALERTGVDAYRAIHVGDNYNKDVLGAVAAGIDAVLLDRAGGEAVHDPTIRSLDELLVLLE